MTLCYWDQDGLGEKSLTVDGNKKEFICKTIASVSCKRLTKRFKSACHTLTYLVM